MTHKAQKWGKAIALAAAFLVGPQTAPAQAGPDTGGGNPPFAGGQMVRGTVTAAAPDHLTVKTESGDLYQVTVTGNTRIMKARQPVKLVDIKAGDGIGAAGNVDASAKTVHAAVLMVVDAEQLRRAEENLGKTYITGRVKAIDDLKLTIARPDGVTPTIEVDEQTSFRRGGRGMGLLMGGAATGGPDTSNRSGPAPANSRTPQSGQDPGGESITLADIKVGDSVVGQGSVKHGVFVPTQLGVITGGARGRRRNGADAPGTPASETGATPPPQTGASPK